MTKLINEFSFNIRVYYEDTDAAGVVYHSQYLNFMERARTEWLRKLGLEQDILKKEFDIAFVVQKMAIEYKKPALFNQLLQIRSKLIELRKVRLVFQQTIIHNDTLLTQAEVVVACIQATSFRPHPIPKQIIEDFTRGQ